MTQNLGHDATCPKTNLVCKPISNIAEKDGKYTYENPKANLDHKWKKIEIQQSYCENLVS